MKRILAACLAVSCCTSAFVARADEPSFTLEQALERAGATSPAIESGAAGVLAAQAARTVAGLRPNPELNIQTENIAGSGDYRGFRSAETTAQVTLPLELGGKRPARLALANAQQDRAQIEQAVIAADLRLAVTQAYVTAVSAAERATVAQRQVAIAAEALRSAQVRVRAGRASPLEAQRAELAHLNAQATQEQAERLANVARANLSRMIGAPVEGALARLIQRWGFEGWREWRKPLACCRKLDV